jgi:hypothetical protein
MVLAELLALLTLDWAAAVAMVLKVVRVQAVLTAPLEVLVEVMLVQVGWGKGRVLKACWDLPGWVRVMVMVAEHMCHQVHSRSR